MKLADQIAIVTGAGRNIGEETAKLFAREGAGIAVVDMDRTRAGKVAEAIQSAGGKAKPYICDVSDENQIVATVKAVADDWGRVDILMNAAGGNVARSRNDAGKPVFDVPMDAYDEVLRLNLHGSVVPTMVFGETMARQKSGSIVNISSMAAMRALSGTLGYSCAKAGIDIFTKWMAVELAQKYGGGIRVNAIAPGFFIGEQNRALLTNPDGSFTARGNTIIGHTPMGRFGRADEVVGAVVWLCSDAASFVTGVVIPIDGGFSSFTGV